MARCRARNRYERCVQVLRWLMEEFEIEDGTLRLEWCNLLAPDRETGKETVYGLTTEAKDRIVIRLSERGCRTTALAVETLIHETAHAYLWETGRGLLHGPEFWQILGRMSDAFDHHGHEDSKHYFVD